MCGNDILICLWYWFGLELPLFIKRHCSALATTFSRDHHHHPLHLHHHRFRPYSFPSSPLRHTLCRTALPIILYTIRASLPLVKHNSLPLSSLLNSVTKPIPFPVVSLDRLSWRSIKSLQPLSPPPAPHHRFPSVKHPQVHPPPLSPAVPL
jgi:hypothetical protein